MCIVQHLNVSSQKRIVYSPESRFQGYCVRFYDRRFITRDDAHKGILERFEMLMNEYFPEDKPQTIGLPSVAYCATELHLSQVILATWSKRKRGNLHRNIFNRKLLI